MRVERTADPRIVYVHDVFSSGECGEIIQLAESIGFREQGRVVVEGGEDIVNPRFRRCHEIWLNRHPELAELNEKVAQRYQNIASLYRENVASVAADLVEEPPRLVRYRPTGFFGMHTDLRHCCPGEWRQLTVVIHLNHTTGGQVFFPNQGQVCHTSPGSALVFPVSDNYLHEAFAPENDSKYILLSWLAASSDIFADKAELLPAKGIAA
ncbi:2OG-Fe(II) oxygenase [Microbulbifer sp. PSTR4-B]|uniref:2OG-Fe(II) oxygenase n=1 Tax=unclassified Microbulbifer TaxID=2619833 RepID=UPI00403AFD7C